MIFNPRTPLIIGGALILGLGGLLATYSPHPGALSLQHAGLENMANLAGCESCHSSRGMAAGCLDCHTEIARQLSERRGYHHHLLDGKEVKCSECHAEHNGTHFPLLNETAWGPQTFRSFKHPHTKFSLVEAHETLLCEACHREKLPHPFTLEDYPGMPRRQTFLGLKQECRFCHPDIHSADLSGPCEPCHGQKSFRPTVAFDHTPHFPLDGGHARLECKGCHVLPHPQSPRRPEPFPFDIVRGTGCAECHDSPHRSLPTAACEGCHRGSDPRWSGAALVLTPETHAETGFALVAPHAEVSCDGCHKPELPFKERYPDPTAEGYRRGQESCEGCHRDVHEGQFQGRYNRCMDCHAKVHFRPATFSHATHAKLYPLTGGHAAVACSACHLAAEKGGPARYAGTSKECRACHDDPHGGQFAAEQSARDCAGCHDVAADSFRIRPFAHGERTGYQLLDAHARVDCTACHREQVALVNDRTAQVRKYRGTRTDCGACHRDVHRGQLSTQGPEACASCHISFANWTEVRFDHNRQSRFPLEGAHARTACSRCHARVTLADGSEIAQYKPLGRECTDCHDLLRKE